jgi:ribonuclease HI
MPYVITEPESIRGVYDSWAECKSVISGESGARCQKVRNREEGYAMLAGRGVVLEPGLYVFTDGNHLGGVGVVVVWVADNASAEPNVVQEIATSVGEIFHGAGIPGLDSDQAIDVALARLRNPLAELAGLYLALRQAPAQAEMTIVHDYKGVSAFLQDQAQWSAKDPIMKAVVSASRDVKEGKQLRLRFMHQSGHTATWAGRHDPGRLNARADALATEGSPGSMPNINP